MTRLRDLPFRRRLTLAMMLTSGLALALACLAFVSYEALRYRRDTERELTSLARVVGANTTAALTFHDPKAAEEVLAALGLKPHIVSAHLFDSDGRAFAAYRRGPAAEPPAPGPGAAPASRVEGRHLLLYEPVVLDGERIGTILLRSDIGGMVSRVADYALVVLLVLVVSAAAALALAARLGGAVSGPVARLAQAARAVSETRDYSVRVAEAGRDELGVLTQAFNEMLSQIQHRDTALRSVGEELARRFEELQREIHERQQAESALRQREEQLQQAQKMEAVGRLAGGVAHDFNNLLTVITGYSDLLERSLGVEHPQLRKVEGIRKAADQAANLTRQLLAFSRKQVLEPRVLSLNAVLTVTASMLKPLLGEHIELVTALAKDLRSVKADPGQIQQVAMNLAINARDAMRDGGVLAIETANIDPDAVARLCPEARPGPYVMLAVRDSGCGMTPDTVSRIFEPFFTTKELGKGTGLGLSMVYGIVKQSDGHITVESETGNGTTFRVLLPALGEEARGTDAVQPSQAAAVGTETICLVEDEDNVRALVSEALRARGFQVMEAADGGEALAALERHPGPVHLLLTDVVMPNLSGPALTARVAALRPDMRFLFMSGHTADMIGENGILDDATHFIGKPFAPQALVLKVREVLDGPARVSRAAGARPAEALPA